MKYFLYLLTLFLTFIAASNSAFAAYREVECRIVSKDEPCQWVYKNQVFPPAIKAITPKASTNKRYAKRTVRPNNSPKPALTVKALETTKPKNDPQPVKSESEVNPQTPNREAIKPLTGTRPPYLDINSLLDDIRQLKPFTQPSLTGYVIEHKPAPLKAEDVDQKPEVTNKPKTKHTKKYQLSFHHKKPSGSSSWVSGLNEKQAKDLAIAITTFIVQQKPPASTVLKVQPTAHHTPLASNLINELRHAGFAIAEFETDTEASKIRYIVDQSESGVLVRIQVDQIEASRWYILGPTQDLVAVSPYFIRKWEANP